MMWHPAHFDEDGKEIKGTNWSLEIHGSSSIEVARHNLQNRHTALGDSLFGHDQDLD